jgi:DNA-binding winged helix-turn-helix (wHTH) protein
VDPAGRWLIADGGARIDLDGHPVLQRVLAVLAQAPEPLSVMALFEAAWPDERIQPESAANRVYTAVRALRRAGAAIITRPGRGYVLDHSGGFSHRSGRP